MGRYKKYTEKDRFRIPNTLRSIGGRATELRFEVGDETYNCEPHALDYPVDNLERLESEDRENALREGAVAVAGVAALAHEKSVIDAAISGFGGPWDGQRSDGHAVVFAGLCKRRVLGWKFGKSSSRVWL